MDTIPQGAVVQYQEEWSLIFAVHARHFPTSYDPHISGPGRWGVAICRLVLVESKKRKIGQILLQVELQSKTGLVHREPWAGRDMGPSTLIARAWDNVALHYSLHGKSIACAW
jgi:hypothetical protein